MNLQAHPIVRGDSESFSFTIRLNGEPADLTGWTLWFTAKRSLSDPDEEALIAKMVTEHQDAAAGKTGVKLTPEDTRRIAQSSPFDVQVKTADGEVKTIYFGRLVPTHDVTLSTETNGST